MERLLNGLRKLLPMRPSMEITMEANPGTFEQERFNAYRSAGITRLSIGIQSFNPTHLRTLERIHNGDEALKATDIAKQAGFNNLNLDLMFGLPKQTQEEALQDLQQAINCKPTHISWYQLTIEANTLFHHKRPKNLPNSDQLATLQEAGIILLEQHGYHQYEVSAFAQHGKECQHNRNYWEFGDYIGIGAGAHGKNTLNQQITRYHKYKQPKAYLDACSKGTPRAKTEILDPKDLPFEFMLNALRLKQGFEKELVNQRTYLNGDDYVEGMKKAIALGLIKETKSHIKTTQRGWDFLNTTMECFL